MPSKIYLASDNRGKFAFLAQGSQGANIADDAADADFIVVDLVDPLAVKAEWIPKATKQVRPFILTALGGTYDPADIAIIRTFFEYIPPICHDEDEVKGTLRLLQSSIDAATSMVVQKLKLEGLDR